MRFKHECDLHMNAILNMNATSSVKGNFRCQLRFWMPKANLSFECNISHFRKMKWTTFPNFKKSGLGTALQVSRLASTAAQRLKAFFLFGLRKRNEAILKNPTCNNVANAMRLSTKRFDSETVDAVYFYQTYNNSFLSHKWAFHSLRLVYFLLFSQLFTFQKL